MTKKIEKKVKSTVSNNKTNCKLKKAIKQTSKKIQFDKEKLVKTLKLLKQSNNELANLNKKLFYNNIYLYISLKKTIKETINRPIVKYSTPYVNKENKLKICIVSNEPQEMKDKLLLSLSETDFAKSFKNIQDLIEIKSLKEFMEMLKKSDAIKSLNYNYHSFLVESRLIGKIKNFLGEESDDLDIVLFNKMSKNFENEKKQINSLINGAKITTLSKGKIYRIKICSCHNSLRDIYLNVRKSTLRVLASLILKSEKHNTIQTLVLKTEDSVPFSIYKEIDANELNYFMNKEEENEEEISEEKIEEN